MTEKPNPEKSGGSLGSVFDALEHPPPPKEPAAPSERTSIGAHMTFLLCGAMVVLFSIWASISTLDIVSMATGEVIPSTQVKTIQHLEGGIVREILVREGESVRKGQLLMKLEPTASDADVSELQVRLRSLILDEARLEALASGAEKPNFSSELVKSHPKLVSQARTSFNIGRRRHSGEIVRQKQAIAQRKQEIIEISTRIRSAKAEQKPVIEKFNLSKELMKDSLGISIKQSFEIFGEETDFHIYNCANLKEYDYSTNNPIVIEASTAPYKLGKCDLKFFIREREFRNSVAATEDFDSWTFEKNTLLRPYGPGIMYEVVFYTLQHLGISEVTTIGWDNKLIKGTAAQQHFYDKVDSSYKKEDFISANEVAANPSAVETLESEASTAAAAILPWYKWLKSQGTNLKIISSINPAPDDIERVEI